MYVTKRSMANAVSSMTKHLEQVSSALAVSFFLYPFIMLSQAWHSISYELLRYWNIWKISGYHGEAWPRAMEMLYSRQRLFLFRESVVFQLQTWCITNLSYFDRFNWIILCIVDNCHIAIVSIMYRYFFILLFFYQATKRHLTQRIENLDGKVDEQNGNLREIKKEVCSCQFKPF